MRKYISLAALALLVSSCDKEFESQGVAGANQIQIEASIEGTRATLTAFEVDDRMSLYAVEYAGNQVAEVQTAGNYINNEPMVYNGTEWTSERSLYWSETECDFYGFYPYQPTGAMKECCFDIALDQSQDGYETSDIMWAKAEKVTREDGAVKLQFKHLMTRVVVEIVRGTKYEGELPNDIDVHIYNTQTTAIVDWTIGSLKAYPQGGRKTINMRKVDADTFDAIVVPQFIERRTPLIEITMGGIAYLLETSMSFRPGKQHTITVTLNTSPDQEKIEINIDGEVGDWQ